MKIKLSHLLIAMGITFILVCIAFSNADGQETGEYFPIDYSTNIMIYYDSTIVHPTYLMDCAIVEINGKMINDKKIVNYLVILDRLIYLRDKCERLMKIEQERISENEAYTNLLGIDNATMVAP